MISKMKNRVVQQARYHYFLTICLLATAVTSSCTGSNETNNQPASTKVAPQGQREAIWTCAMHPQVRERKPGSCPICKMNLVKVLQAEAADPQHEHPSSADGAEPTDEHAPVTLSFERQQMIGVKFGKAQKRELFKEIRAPGRVAFDPELYVAQNEYQEALRQLERIKDSPLADVRHSASKMVESAKLRLKILGLSDTQIAALGSSEKTEPSLLIHHPGQDIWVYAEVYEMDLPYVRAGMEAKISATFLEGKTLSGKVVSVDRVLNPATRTAKMRISLSKARISLRPEVYVDVSLYSPLGKQLAVPFDAILDTGRETWVFVAGSPPSGEKDHKAFSPRKVTLKFIAGDWAAIESGVEENETIVTSANFLVDSESRLKATLSAPQAPKCPEKQHWDTSMTMCMPDTGG